jgi:CheY-like chemotaxis protein
MPVNIQIVGAAHTRGADDRGVLLVEDDAADALLIKEALSGFGWPSDGCHAIQDGAQAFASAVSARTPKEARNG